jgi:hypothetical protein
MRYKRRSQRRRGFGNDSLAFSNERRKVLQLNGPKRKKILN